MSSVCVVLDIRENTGLSSQVQLISNYPNNPVNHSNNSLILQ